MAMAFYFRFVTAAVCVVFVVLPACAQTTTPLVSLFPTPATTTTTESPSTSDADSTESSSASGADGTSEPQVFSPLTCAQANAIMPNWQDATCRTYLRCDHFVLTELSCGDKESFSLTENLCVPSELVNCEEQNKALKTTVQASAYLYQLNFQSYEMTHDEESDVDEGDGEHGDDEDDDGDDGDDEDGDGDAGEGDHEETEEETEDGGDVLPVIDTSHVSDMLHGLTNRRPGRVKRQIWTHLGMPTSHSVKETIDVTFPSSICERILFDTSFMEVMTNAVLLMETGCSVTSCGIPLLKLRCEGEDEGAPQEGAGDNSGSAENTPDVDSNVDNRDDNTTETAHLDGNMPDLDDGDDETRSVNETDGFSNNTNTTAPTTDNDDDDEDSNDSASDQDGGNNNNALHHSPIFSRLGRSAGQADIGTFDVVDNDADVADGSLDFVS